MRSPIYYAIRTLVRASLVLALLVGLFIAVDHINWVGNGYCTHTMSECYKEGK